MTTRTDLARFGPARRSVRVFVEQLAAGPLVRVQWREHGAVKTKSWPDTKANRAAAKAWAKGFAETRDQVRPRSPITVRGLWDLFIADQGNHLRQRTQDLYLEYWNRWEIFAGAGFPAEQVTRVMIMQFRRELETRQGRDKKGLAATTVRDCLKVVKRVYSWAEQAEILEVNRWRSYTFKVGKDQRPVPPAEYRTDDHGKILAALRPELASQWRAYVALAVCGFQGARQNAVLHLRWADLDLEGKTVTWRALWDKLGREWVQPLREPTLAALAIAREHRERMGYTGPWVLPPASRKSGREVYSAQSLWQALKEAERRAGVPHLERRGAHGLRRLLAGDVASATGNAMLGLRAIGDKDPRMLERYVQKRDDELAAAFAQLDRNQSATAPGEHPEAASESEETQ